MTYRDRYHQLQTELAALDDLLAIAPEDAVIDRFSIQKRKDRVVLLLENTSNPEQWPFNARVSFNGKPVESGQGINADFGGEAMSSLAKFITSLAASQWSSLGERGVIPNREDYQVVITGTSLGSFSFDIEEVPVQQSTYLEGPTPVEVAIQQAKEIMRASTGESEGLAEAIEETDNRALNDLRSFIRLLSESDAVCSLSAKGDTFSFGSMSQVRTALINLSLDNVIEDEIELSRTFSRLSS